MAGLSISSRMIYRQGLQIREYCYDGKACLPYPLPSTKIIQDVQKDHRNPLLALQYAKDGVIIAE